MMNNLLDLTLDELKIWMKDNGENVFRAKQIQDFIYKDVWDFEKMTNLSKATLEKIKTYFYIGIPKMVKLSKSKQDDTIKFLFEYNDGSLIESVVMKYKHGFSICVSTQVGCRMGCKFCASTIGGMIRNLSAGEILAQILAAQKEVGERISNVVLMGSGEPLDNYDNVIKFLELANAEYGLNIGQRHITLSTCGIVPKIYSLADKDLQITLAISLHAPNDEARKNMMPIANKYSIKEILEACRYYIDKTNRRITYEYALVKGVNDNREQAKELAQLLQGMLCHVNLIPVNQVEKNNFEKSTTENIKTFSDVLTKHGIENTIRREMGADIDAACGQLRRKYLDEKKEAKGV